jgi:hypothetical protein
VVPKNDYQSLNSSDARSWRIKTTRNELYSVDRFRNTDSTLVVQSVIHISGADSEGTQFTVVRDDELPFEIRHSDIDNVRGLYVTDERKIVVLSVIGATVGITAGWLLMVALFAHE